MLKLAVIFAICELRGSLPEPRSTSGKSAPYASCRVERSLGSRLQLQARWLEPNTLLRTVLCGFVQHGRRRPMTTQRKYSIYVFQLGATARNDSAFEHAMRDPRKPCLYVGSTAKS